MQRSFTGFVGSRRARRQSSGRWRLPLERLEDRVTPAGNVLATQVGAMLTLTGDDLGNNIMLLPGGAPNEIVVMGVDTTVNGSTDPQTFTGVYSLDAELQGGNDVLTADGIVISVPFFSDAESLSQIVVDGGAGDDQIAFLNTSVNARDAIDMEIFGERVTATSASGSTGNDSITISGSSFTTTTFVSVVIFGETNEGGVVTGGNDTISIADSTFATNGPFFNSVFLGIVGDQNESLAGETSTIGGGNDRISVSNTTLSATGDTSFGSFVTMLISGDANSAAGFDNSFNPGDATATIGGGNDRIDVTNTTFTAFGQNSGGNVSVQIVGEQQSVQNLFPGGTATATIGGGNDRITVADSAVTAGGNQFNGATLEVDGASVSAIGLAGATSTIGGGDETINVRNTNITAGPGPFGDFAALVIRSENVVAFGGVISVIGSGNDVVRVNNVHTTGAALGDFGFIQIETGSGNDRVDILNSSSPFFTVHLGDGDDSLLFNNNIVDGGEASLDGGPGFDKINAHGNTGTLIYFDFEDVNVS